MKNKSKLQEEEYKTPYHWKMGKGGWINFKRKNSLIFKLLEPLKNKEILDVGCGDGRFTFELSERAKRVTGVDISERAIGFARKLVPKCKFYVMDAEKLDFKDSSFDVVTMMEFIEHMPKAIESKVIKEATRVLKSGGSLLLTTPSKRVPLLPKHYRHYSFIDIEKLLNPWFKKVKLTGYTVYIPFLYKFRIRKFFYILYKSLMRECRPEISTTIIAYCEK